MVSSPQPPRPSSMVPGGPKVLRMSLPKELLLYCLLFGFSFPLMVLMIVF